MLSLVQRSHLLAAAAAIAATLRQDDLERAQAQEAAVAAADAPQDPQGCAHPAEKRTPTPRMGAPGAFICNDCQQEVTG